MRSSKFMRYALLASATSLLTGQAVAAPAVPAIAWLETTHAAPASYVISWDMWWGDNGDTWHLIENSQIIHTATITANSPNAQQAQFAVQQSSGGEYVYQVKLCDTSVTPESCSLSATKTITVTGDAVNQAPSVNAGVDQSIEVGSTANLNASYTDDGLATPLTFNWSQVSGPGVTSFADTSAAITTASFTAEGTYVLRFTVDDSALSGHDDITITVNAVQPNQAPVANAGLDIATSVGELVTLQGSFTDDGKSTPLTQIWAQTSGPETVSLSNANTTTASATFNMIGTYGFQLTVDDGEFSSTDSMNVVVSAASALETPNAPEIAWMSPDADLSNGDVDINLAWTKYSGVSGNFWRLLQNDVEIFSANISENGTGRQEGSTSVTLSQSGSYQYVVSLCQVQGTQESCSQSSPFTITATGGSTATVSGCDAAIGEACLPNRADPVSLKVKGWPNFLAMGSITDNNSALNNSFAAAQLDAIFKYSGDGAGNRGQLIEPTVSLQTLAQAREIEAINDSQVMPTLVVYTANASSGGVAAEDITNYENLVIHYQNLIRLSAALQGQKDTTHEHPATIILNADLLGEWQKSQDTDFKSAFGDESAWTTIAVKQALKEAITKETNYVVALATGGTSTLDAQYNLAQLKTDIDANIDDNIKGWVQSQNFILKQFSPDVPFSWLVNLWNPGSANWVHNDFSGLESTWNGASKSVAEFIDWIGAYQDNQYRPDFIAFDKYERDGFSILGRANYAFGAKEWDNYLTYVKQITDHLDRPAMIWQLPGGHMPSTAENVGDYDFLNNASSAGSYFMGDSNIGTQISNIRPELLNIALDPTVYNGASTVSALLNQAPEHDWGQDRLRHSAYSNIFSLLWGGGSTTAVVPINTNGEGDNNWLSNKIAAYKQQAKVPLYHLESASSSVPLTAIAALNADLEAIESTMDNEVFLYETPSSTWEPSTIYKWADFLAALNPMHNVGIGDVKFWLTDPTADDETNIKYAKVAIAAFLAQSMKETIQYNACDENNWSIDTGDPVNYPLSASCGQLGQVYADYGIDAQGVDNPYSCPRNDKMEISAITHAKWYGAPAPLFTAPDAVLEEKGLLVNGHVGRWDYQTHCQVSPTSIDDNAQVYLREECEAYVGQKAGKFVWDGSAEKSVQGCGWWGRGVIQTTGRLNFGKLNHFIGRSHVSVDKIGTDAGGTTVQAAPANPLYADLDLCANPQLICSTQEHKEIKWIAGLFFWMNEVQGYNNVGGPYASWNYHEQLKAYVDGGLQGSKFIDDVSGIVNRGCPDTTCPVSGEVDGLAARKANFVKALQAMGLNPL